MAAVIINNDHWMCRAMGDCWCQQMMSLLCETRDLNTLLEFGEPAAGESAPISPEVPQAHGLTTPATPSAAVGASEPGAGDTDWKRRQKIRKAVKEYSENTTAETSPPAESPDDWVMITDPKHVIRRVDACRQINDGVWTPCCASVGATIDEWKNLEFRCRRKDLPVVPSDKPLPQPWNPMIGTPSVETALRQFVEWHDMDHENMTGVEVQSTYDKVIADAKSALQADADKPRMRQVTLREYVMSGKSYWTTSDAEIGFTGRTAVVEVPE